MIESVRYNPQQEGVVSSGAESYRDNKAFRDAVESIKILARTQKKSLLEKLSGLDKIPNIILSERGEWMSDKRLKGIVLSTHEPRNRTGYYGRGDSIVLVSGEGIVRMSWNNGHPFNYVSWEKRSEVSAQDYIKYTPLALLEIARIKEEGENCPTQDLVGHYQV